MNNPKSMKGLQKIAVGTLLATGGAVYVTGVGKALQESNIDYLVDMSRAPSCEFVTEEPTSIEGYLTIKDGESVNKFRMVGLSGDRHGYQLRTDLGFDKEPSYSLVIGVPHGSVDDACLSTENQKNYEPRY